MSSPSNPSPFSAELQAFIVTKYDPLLSIVKELNERLQTSDKERWRLECRVSQIEDRLKTLGDFVPGSSVGGDGKDDSLEEEAAIALSTRRKKEVARSLDNDQSLSGPWLFSCQSGTPMSAIQVLLEFTPDSSEELDTRLWGREEDMWIAFLEDLPDAVTVKPEGLQLMALRKTARQALMELCKTEFLLLLRGVPGRENAARHPVEITLVAILASAFSEAWQRVEGFDPDNLGRIALVLEGRNIGSRLRAGTNRFQIEPLN